MSVVNSETAALATAITRTASVPFVVSSAETRSCVSDWLKTMPAGKPTAMLSMYTLGAPERGTLRMRAESGLADTVSTTYTSPDEAIATPLGDLKGAPVAMAVTPPPPRPVLKRPGAPLLVTPAKDKVSPDTSRPGGRIPPVSP